VPFWWAVVMWRLAWFSMVVAAWLAAPRPAPAGGGVAVCGASRVGTGFLGDGLEFRPTGVGGLGGSKDLPPGKGPIVQVRPGRFIRVLGGAGLASEDGAEQCRPSSPGEAAARPAPGFRPAGRCILLCRFLL